MTFPIRWGTANKPHVLIDPWPDSAVSEEHGRWEQQQVFTAVSIPGLEALWEGEPHAEPTPGIPSHLLGQLYQGLMRACDNLVGQAPCGRPRTCPLNQPSWVRSCTQLCSLVMSLHLGSRDSTGCLVTGCAARDARGLFWNYLQSSVCGMRPERWPPEGKGDRRAAGAFWVSDQSGAEQKARITGSLQTP